VNATKVLCANCNADDLELSPIVEHTERRQKDMGPNVRLFQFTFSSKSQRRC
jgi:hypothetical protein